MSNYLNIPLELRAIPQWVVWKYEQDEMQAGKPTKVPYSPRTGRHASVNDPTSWATFEAAHEASVGFDGIGFIFTENDPYAFVDLDDHKGDQTVYERQQRLFIEFDSYSEISPSGKGLHVICKGSIPTGRKRFGIELYSSKRFATMTGNVYSHKPIEDRNELLNQVYVQLGGLTKDGTYVDGAEQRYTDEQIIQMASNAKNGEKFLRLLDGNWQHDYPPPKGSQSEGDFAFIDIISFYSQNRAQISRMFSASKFGQTPKGPYLHRGDRKDYVEYMINRSFDNMTPYVDIQSLKNSLNEVIGATAPAPQLEMFNTQQAIEKGPARNIGSVPPGLLGEIATYIFDSAPRPVPEIALTAAIGLMAGICGRAYNISGAGLNQYVIVLAGTGTGKEAGTSGVTRLMASIRTRVPASVSFIGPSKISSESALIKFIANRSQCFVSMIGEFGYFMEEIGSHNSTSVLRGLRKMLLDMYNKSGAGQQMFESAFSDKEQSTGIVQSPSVTIMGESTQEKFFSALDEAMIVEGLLPRFLILEYNGPMVPLNEGHKNVLPPFNVTSNLATLCAHCHMLMHNGKPQDVQLNGDAHRLMKRLEEFQRMQVNKSNREVLKHLWTRVHMKALKLAALVAVGVNPYDPIINKDMAEWAINIVRGDAQAMIHRFEIGEIGKDSEETKQVQKIVDAIKQYLIDPEIIIKYNLDRRMHKDRVIPSQYIQRRLGADAAFRNDRNGATYAIKRTLQVLIDGGDIAEVGKHDMSDKYGFTGRAFMLANTKLIGAI